MNFMVVEGTILYNKRYVISQESILIPRIMREYHDSPIGAGDKVSEI